MTISSWAGHDHTGGVSHKSQTRKGPRGGIAAVTLIVTATTFLASCHAKSPPQTVSPTENAALLTAAGQELVALLRTGQKAAFHAGYRVRSNPATVGGMISIEVWQAPPLTREDSTLVVGNHTTRTESFIQSTSTSTCVQTDNGPWKCERGNAAATKGPSSVLAAVNSTIGGQPVVAYSATASGRHVRCFDVGMKAPERGTVQLCLTSGGIPVLIASDQVRYELATLSNTVDRSVFTQPNAP